MCINRKTLFKHKFVKHTGLTVNLVYKCKSKLWKYFYCLFLGTQWCFILNISRIADSTCTSYVSCVSWQIYSSYYSFCSCRFSYRHIAQQKSDLQCLKSSLHNYLSNLYTNYDRNPQIKKYKSGNKLYFVFPEYAHALPFCSFPLLKLR